MNKFDQKKYNDSFFIHIDTKSYADYMKTD